jgi:hypothetical protein
MFWIGLGVGLIVGGTVGALIISMLVMGKNGD